MRYNEDKRIKLPVPFLKDDTILFIDGCSGESDSQIRPLRDNLMNCFEELGYSFIFLPDLVKNLSPDIVRYMFPGYEGSLCFEEMYQRIRQLAKLENKIGFLYKQKGLTFFHSVPKAPQIEFESSIESLIEYLRDTQEPEYNGVNFSLQDRDEIASGSFISKSELPRINSTIDREDFADYYIQESLDEDLIQLDSRTRAILEAWGKIEREFGITIQDLDILLGYRVRLSRMTISKQNVIHLVDWEGCPEVKLDDLAKVLYFFFLRHPEGAVLKELESFEKEFFSIYMDITGRDDIKGIQESIARLIHPYSTGRDTLMSRIRKAFRDIVGERAARFYYIDGKGGKSYTIRLDRDYVLWEN